MTTRPTGSLAAVALLALLLPAPARGASPTLEGYTGLLRTPSAWVEEPGRIQLLAGQPGDGGHWTGAMRYAFNFGFLPYLEFALADADPPGAGSDLFAGFKLQLPLDLLFPRLPVGVAVGVSDFAGFTQNSWFRSRYVVATARLGRLDGSLGWGAGPDRLKGIFGGLSFRVVDGVEIVGDWDAADLSVGLKAALSLQPILGSPFSVGGMVASAVTRSPASIAWSVNLEIPLWWNASPGGRWSTPPLDDEAGAPAAAPGAAPPAMAAARGTPAADEDLRRLEDALVADGFEEVRAGRIGDRVVVEYENDRYNQDQADGLYVLLREVERSALAAAPLTVVLKRHGLRLAEMEFAGDRTPGAPLIPPMTGFALTPPELPARWASPSPRNRVPLHSQLVVGPAIRTWVGTEYGLFDYVFSIRPELYVPFWPGALGYLRGDIPVLWSHNLSDGGEMSYLRTGPRLQYALLQQVLGLGRGLLAMVGTGLFATSRFAVLGEALWAVGSGDLALGVQGGWLVDADRRSSASLTGSIRYRVPRIDLVASVRAGQFVDGDVGVSARLAKWFGDTQVGVFYTHSAWAAAGVFIGFPLTFRRDMEPGWIQVRGPRRWTYDIGSRIWSGANYVGGSIGAAPVAPVNLETEYLDESRVSQDGLGRSYE